MLLKDRFEFIVQERPNSIAFIQGDRETSYKELGNQANTLAIFLAEKIKPGESVAILLDNCAEYASSVYGIWKAGGVVVGLNTALKGNDLSELINHCGAKWLIANRNNRELSTIATKSGIKGIVAVGEKGPELPEHLEIQQWGNLAPVSVEPNDTPVKGDDLAAVIYTSGTTGHPKGVMLSHKNLASNIKAIETYLPIVPEDKIMCILPFFYSYGNSLLHSHLAVGACLILENSLMYPQKVLQSMEKHQATAFSGVPSSFYLFLARTDLSKFDLSNLRYCTQAGGGMDKAKIRDWRDQVPCDFYVMYGQTEASARLTYLPPEKLDEKLGSVGIGIPGVKITVRNSQGLECGVGEQGEVCAQGDNVMLGYLNAPDETNETLRNGWLYTGDLGYKDADGFLYLVGRSKEMIKSGAHRINPREIEETIARVSGVDEVAVVGINDDLLGQVIKACVVAGNVAENDLKKSIMRLCKQELAAYKVPKEIEFMESLPKTASGKVKKHLL